MWSAASGARRRRRRGLLLLLLPPSPRQAAARPGPSGRLPAAPASPPPPQPTQHPGTHLSPGGCSSRMPGPGRRGAANRRMKSSAGGRRDRLPGAPKAQPDHGKLCAKKKKRCLGVGWRAGCGSRAEPLRVPQESWGRVGSWGSRGRGGHGVRIPTVHIVDLVSRTSHCRSTPCLLLSVPRRGGEVAGPTWGTPSLRVSSEETRRPGGNLGLPGQSGCDRPRAEP